MSQSTCTQLLVTESSTLGHDSRPNLVSRFSLNKDLSGRRGFFLRKTTFFNLEETKLGF